MQSFMHAVTGDKSNQFTPEDVTDLRGRTTLVTGGTNGIGFEVARGFALAKARVLLLSRKGENGEKALAAIKQDDPGADVQFIECDLGDLWMVKEVADKICKQELRLDILVADAGVGVNKFDLAASGIDRHFAVNHLGHFLLINRLLPLLRRTANLPSARAPRIVSVSSELHRMAPSFVSFASEDEVMKDVGLGPTGYYARSKLANILFTRFGLVEKVFKPNADRIVAVAVHPGAVRTGQPEQMKEAYGPVLGTIMKSLTTPFMRTPEEGSLSALWAATCDDIEKNGWNGKYFTDPGKLSEESKQAQDPDLGRNLWELSERLVVEKARPEALLPWDVSAKA